MDQLILAEIKRLGSKQRASRHPWFLLQTATYNSGESTLRCVH